MSAIDQRQLDAWLNRLGGREEDKEQAIAEMRAAGADVLFPFLIPMLAADVDSRCQACELILLVDAERGLDLVLPLLRDRNVTVRWFACYYVAIRGNARAIPALCAALQSDDDAQVRGTAAGGLGAHGGPEVIPILLETMASDHERDVHGHSPSHCAAMALDEILGTDETCLHLEGVCRMLNKPPDLDRLRHLAEERYQQWLTSGA